MVSALLYSHVPVLVLLVHLGVGHRVAHALAVPVWLAVVSLGTWCHWKQERARGDALVDRLQVWVPVDEDLALLVTSELDVLAVLRDLLLGADHLLSTEVWRALLVALVLREGRDLVHVERPVELLKTVVHVAVRLVDIQVHLQIRVAAVGSESIYVRAVDLLR